MTRHSSTRTADTCNNALDAAMHSRRPALRFFYSIYTKRNTATKLHQTYDQSIILNGVYEQ